MVPNVLKAGERFGEILYSISNDEKILLQSLSEGKGGWGRNFVLRIFMNDLNLYVVQTVQN